MQPFGQRRSSELAAVAPPWPSGWFQFALALMGLLAALPGCAARNVYKARNLPLEFQPPPVADLREIALTQLAASSGPSDVIMPGDLLEVTIRTDTFPDTPPVSCRVDDQGMIQIPAVGPVPVSGLRLSEAEAAIAQAAVDRDVYRRPFVTVNRTALRTYRVTVAGAVQQPGVYAIPAAEADLMAALVRAGGLKPEAEPVAEIRRAATTDLGDSKGLQSSEDVAVRPVSHSEGTPETSEVVKVDLLAASRDPQPAGQYRLEDGDIIYVPEKKRDPIFVDGLVNKPGMYQLPSNQDIRLLDALALAGGRSNPLAEKVWIVRRLPGRSEPVLIRANLRLATKDPQENLRIAPGDVITVEETFGTFVYNLLKGFVHIGGSVPLY